jgi:hypothetical protein
MGRVRYLGVLGPCCRAGQKRGRGVRWDEQVDTVLSRSKRKRKRKRTWSRT